MSLFNSEPKKKVKSHDHQWQIVSKTYAPPRLDVTATDGDKDLIEKLMFGVTAFLWECVLCNETKKDYLVGSETTTLQEELDKAELYGPQYVERNGITFEIKKFQAQSNIQPGMLPLR